MKALKFILIVFATVFFSTSVSAQKQKTVQTATIKTAIYCDHCAHCETCGFKLNKMLFKEKGIQMVVLDLKAMTIKVTYSSKITDLEKIKTAISKLGYDADDIKAESVAYEGLDDCCKKS